MSLHGRGVVLCLGGGQEPAKSLMVQIFRCLLMGNLVKIPVGIENLNCQEVVAAFKRVKFDNLIVCFDAESLEAQLKEPDISVVMFDGDKQTKTKYRQMLAAQAGARIALVSTLAGNEMLTVERVISTDTTASGGNASLLALGDG